MSFQFPPRPTHAIHPSMLDAFDQQGVWLAQYKKNGTGSVVVVGQNRQVSWWTRHGNQHKAWTPKLHHKTWFKKYPGSVWCVELMHNKTPTIKDELYINDVLTWNTQSLVGWGFSQREGLMWDNLVDSQYEETDSHIVLAPGIWLACTYDTGFSNMYHTITDPKVDEGLVLKHRNLPLKPTTRQGSNTDSSVKCRWANQLYGF